MICYWPRLEHPLEHHDLVILVQLYHDTYHMLCAMESCHPKQHILLMPDVTTKYNIKALLKKPKEHSYFVRVTSLLLMSFYLQCFM